MTSTLTCQCGYDLRGLADDANCPECGVVVAESRRNLAWLRSIDLGLTRLLCAYAILLLTTVAVDVWQVMFSAWVRALGNVGGTGPLHEAAGYNTLTFIMIVISAVEFGAMVCLLIGAWRLLTPERLDQRRRRRASIGRGVIGFALGYEVIQLLASFLTPVLVRGFALPIWVGIVDIVLGRVLVLAIPLIIGLRLRTLAIRFSQRRLHTRIIAVLVLDVTGSLIRIAGWFTPFRLFAIAEVLGYVVLMAWPVLAFLLRRSVRGKIRAVEAQA